MVSHNELKRIIKVILKHLKLYYIITQPSIYGVIGYFLQCHESLNYSTGSISMTIDWQYTIGLVSHFPVKNTQALFIMCDDDARTVRL